MSNTSRKPTHTVMVKERAPEGTKAKTGRIGSAWLQEDGSLSIRLEAGVSISWRDDFIITAFPVLTHEQWQEKVQHKARPREEGPFGDSEGMEAPFGELEPPFGNDHG